MTEPVRIEVGPADRLRTPRPPPKIRSISMYLARRSRRGRYIDRGL
ncbi:hypothetical protein HOV17_gp09 [Halorubrum pleomorphic virus 9]|uniref:Uncharacterized protein n=1 Tax=Halorubrum pleomorphic virus 9 TaxID=2126525 RepID=A0A3S7I9H3_9VIRU|nr:hypothetical protein HOV17_gp09 [Halorubrum pleomorphic virus 9]AVP39973.1 hypothetical protein [Halorubrum pleomorphic virus 9]